MAKGRKLGLKIAAGRAVSLPKSCPYFFSKTKDEKGLTVCGQSILKLFIKVLHKIIYTLVQSMNDYVDWLL